MTIRLLPNGEARGWSPKRLISIVCGLAKSVFVGSTGIFDRVGRAVLVLVLGLGLPALATTAANAVTITSLSFNPTTFTNPGTVITFTMGFNTGSRAWNSATFQDQSGPVFTTGSCSPAPNNTTNQDVSCTFTYTTTAGQTQNLQFIPQVTVDGLDTGTYSGIATVTYVPPPPATVTLVSSQNPSSLGAPVTFTVTVGGSNGTPTGSVDIYDFNGHLSVTVPLSGGVAQTTTSALPAGGNDIEADFNPTGTNYSANSDLITQTVNAAGLSMNSTPSAATQVGQSYSQTNVASGGVGPYTYSVTAGSLPAGTSINASTGAVTGIPTTAGAFSYSVQAVDSTNPTHLTITQPTNGTITRGNQTISFTQPADTALTAGPVILTATATS
ncbi:MULTISPECIES: Ig-like domain-containing protein, partial [unclassified Mesorhizobium]|uniref:Ig-like domain-containing protein n=1 Tax=unclassified Mesorhizobium TaxID=325217 RepID=UPI00112B5CED